ncbi:YdiU family protein [cf. Phormidesmis sp. LEGE 11477]|uniref:protein adenylyltransferase SelO n=1 Tax=cf. Phormidesmis sp. LEGE 11477 TaxID=1828680 RepID=UPI0018805640|nr:YdiU family protein [cf. Phormidesmis sp. LEGE 11477]MBE9059849.1 YdiU family protein [cf. Phormidesmis sp. LEGE 11477]
MPAPNPFFGLQYEAALASLGEDFYDTVQPAVFSNTRLRFRNNSLLPLLGLSSESVSDQHFVEAFGQFRDHSSQQPQQQKSQQQKSQQLFQPRETHSPRTNLQTSGAQRSGLALRYHGYQFGQYNPYLGDGRGFLYGQVQTASGQLLDLGTKGSGQTPHSHGRDGRLSLLGGIKEVLAAEALHRLGIPTSRVLSLIETGEELTRADEPSPTRSAVMVRLSRSHIRFGTFERLDYLDRPDLVRRLLDHIISHYYGHLWHAPDRDIQFYAELVQRTAHLVAGWMAAGFCHGVLNTDNMSIVGEGFDYGPYAFIDTYSPHFTAASFDRLGRYSYRNQPTVCRWNLEKLQEPLASVISKAEMESVLTSFTTIYERAYHQRMLRKLGFETLPDEDALILIDLTLQFLFASQVDYHHFFQALQQQFSVQWREEPANIFTDLSFLVGADFGSANSNPASLGLANDSANHPANYSRNYFESKGFGNSNVADLKIVDRVAALKPWREFYHRLLRQQSEDEMMAIAYRLKQHNPQQRISRSAITEIWQAISLDNNWQRFNQTIASCA